MSEFVPFRFNVILFSADKTEALCSGSFSEVTGLEVSMEAHAIAEGGRNWGELQRSGPAKFAPIVLKRGVTEINDLWSWFDVTTRGANYGYRLSGEIEVMSHPRTSGDGQGGLRVNKVMVWKLKEVLPTKFKGADLSSTANQVAIEELTLVHEGLELMRPPEA